MSGSTPDPTPRVRLTITANCMRGKNPCGSVFGLLIHDQSVVATTCAKSNKRAVIREAMRDCKRWGWVLTDVYDQFQGRRVVR